MLKPALQSFASVPSTVIALADRPSCPDHEPQDDQLCSTRSEMVTQKAGGSTTEPASPLGAEYGPLDQIVCEGGGGDGEGGGDGGGGDGDGGGGDGGGGGGDGGGGDGGGGDGGSSDGGGGDGDGGDGDGGGGDGDGDGGDGVGGGGDGVGAARVHVRVRQPPPPEV
eukprot:scaffold76018_cov51-Phaeocystis_antarctica.AAC.2